MSMSGFVRPEAVHSWRGAQTLQHFLVWISVKRLRQLFSPSFSDPSHCSPPHQAPVQSKYVRGEILHGVFHIKAGRNKKHSEFTMVHHFNPGGNIPPWLMNWLAEGKPLTFVRKLEKVAEKWDKQAALSKSMPCKGRGFGEVQGVAQGECEFKTLCQSLFR